MSPTTFRGQDTPLKSGVSVQGSGKNYVEQPQQPESLHTAHHPLCRDSDGQQKPFQKGKKKKLTSSVWIHPTGPDNQLFLSNSGPCSYPLVTILIYAAAITIQYFDKQASEMNNASFLQMVMDCQEGGNI